MADSLFEVKYGLQVGNTTIYAANGDISTSGNLTVTGNVAVSKIENGNSNVVVNANGTVDISSTGQDTMISADGSGNLIYLNRDTIIFGSVGMGGLDPNDFSSFFNNLVVDKNIAINDAEGALIFVNGFNTSDAGGAIIYDHTVDDFIFQVANDANGTPFNIMVLSNIGANIAGYANITGAISGGSTLSITGNANVGNLGTSGLVTAGNLTAGNISIVGDTISSANATITIDPSTAGAAGTVIIAGNLQVDGTTTTINSTTVTIDDLLLVLASGAINAAAANGAGISIDGASASITYNSTSNTFVYTHGANITGNITLSGNIVDTGALDISTGSNGNLSLSPNGTGQVVTAANINAPRLQNGNSGVAITANANVTINVTAANSYTFATGSFAPSANATVQLGLTGARWSNIWGLASSAQYADLAERYDAGIYIEPGTVVEFGGDNEVQICGTQMSTKVAGVVSTAPGYLMNDTEDKGDNWVPVALQGRVPTKVVGPVVKGDMMVSAGNGHAMACSAPVVGSVIGKALENFDGAEGVIEVVVGRI